VHVLRKAFGFFCFQKPQLARLPEDIHEVAEHSGKFKHHGNWCSNRLAVTISVNARALLFSPTQKQRFAPVPV
jgi:hypothetical protein